MEKNKNIKLELLINNELCLLIRGETKFLVNNRESDLCFNYSESLPLNSNINIRSVMGKYAQHEQFLEEEKLLHLYGRIMRIAYREGNLDKSKIKMSFE